MCTVGKSTLGNCTIIIYFYNSSALYSSFRILLILYSKHYNTTFTHLLPVDLAFMSLGNLRQTLL